MKHDVYLLDLKKLNDDQWNDYYAFCKDLYFEVEPDGIYLTIERFKQSKLDDSPYTNSARYCVKDSTERIIGIGSASWANERSPSFEENKHIAHISVHVGHQHRRSGVGRAIYSTLAEYLKSSTSVTKITFSTSQDSGKVFANKLNAKNCLESVENRLYLDRVDWTLIEHWRERGIHNLDDAKIEVFKKIPESDLEAMCFFYNETYNAIPSGELDGIAKVTTETIRHSEERIEKYGLENPNIITREANGSISGLTDVIYDPSHPIAIGQQLTGVFAEHQRKGRAKWLKAEMLLHIRENYPEVKYITTGNSNENTAMLSINERLGFEPHRTYTSYELVISEADCES